MRRLVTLAFLLLLAPAAPASASPHTFVSGDEVVSGFGAENAKYRSCRSKARRAYGPVKGRHSSGIRLAIVSQCVSLGGRLP